MNEAKESVTIAKSLMIASPTAARIGDNTILVYSQADVVKALNYLDEALRFLDTHFGEVKEEVTPDASTEV